MKCKEWTKSGLQNIRVMSMCVCQSEQWTIYPRPRSENTCLLKHYAQQSHSPCSKSVLEEVGEVSKKRGAYFPNVTILRAAIISQLCFSLLVQTIFTYTNPTWQPRDHSSKTSYKNLPGMTKQTAQMCPMSGPADNEIRLIVWMWSRYVLTENEALGTNGVTESFYIVLCVEGQWKLFSSGRSGLEVWTHYREHSRQQT